ncbi:MAG: TolC family protein [Candidatus Atribacteria bacterium]|nr:TolC family protein [Candidatus Atribacteria bacterium]
MRTNIKIKTHSRIMTSVVALILIFISTFGIASAEEITPEEAIQWGIEHNYDLNAIRYSITELERNLDILDASESFQVNLSATPIWYFGKNEEEVIEMSDSSLTPSTEISVTATKVLADNIHLSTELAWESGSIDQIDLEEMVKEINADIKLSKQIYPETWTDNEKQVFDIKNSLQIRLEELKWEVAEKQIEFIQDYLEIIRLQEQVNISKEQVRLAEETLARVKREIALGEGGYQQEAEAQITLDEAKNQLFSLEQSLGQTKKQWYLILGLPKETVVSFENGSDFIQALFSQMETLQISDDKTEELINEALENHYQLKNSTLEKEALLKELEWAKDNGKPKVNLSAGYQYPDDWFAMIDFSVNLADGGLQKLEEEQKQADIEQKEVSITYLVEQIILELEQLMDQDQYNQLHLNTQFLALEKEQNRTEIIEKQYRQGSISISLWQNELLTLIEKELNVKQAEDQWFINRLKLAHFIGCLQEEI